MIIEQISFEQYIEDEIARLEKPIAISSDLYWCPSIPDKNRYMALVAELRASLGMVD
jgi:hypothetical protein